MTTPETVGAPAAAVPVPETVQPRAIEVPGATTCAPGKTTQLFVELDRSVRIVNVAKTPGVEIVSIMAGTSDVRLPEGATWDEVLRTQLVRADRGAYVIVNARNAGSVPVRMKTTLYVVEEAVSPQPSAVSPRNGGRGSVTERTATSEPVRFVIGRGIVPYLVAFVAEGRPFPATMHAAALQALTSSAMRRTAESKPLRAGSDVEITLPASVLAEIGRALRTKSPIKLHPEDKMDAAASVRESLQPTAVSRQLEKIMRSSTYGKTASVNAAYGKATVGEPSREESPPVVEVEPDWLEDYKKVVREREQLMSLVSETTLQRNTAVDRFHAAEKQLTDLENRHRAVNFELAEARATVDHLQMAHNELRPFKTYLDLEKELAEARATVDQLHTAIAEKRPWEVELEKQIATERSVIVGLQTDLVIARATIVSLHTEADERDKMRSEAEATHE